MDEFTNHRYNELATAFVELYTKEGKFLAAKMIKEENVPKDHYPVLRERIEKEFLKRGYTFNESKESESAT